MSHHTPESRLAHQIGNSEPNVVYAVDDGPGQIATIERYVNNTTARYESGCLLFLDFEGKRYMLAIAEYGEPEGEDDLGGEGGQ